MTPSEITAFLRGTRNGKWINIRGRGHGPRDRSLGILLHPRARDGFVVHSFADEDAEDARLFVKSQLKGQRLTGTLSAFADDEVQASQLKKICAAKRLFEEAIPLAGTPAEQYLANRQLFDSTVATLQHLRFHPSCPFGPFYRAPALVAGVHNVLSGTLQAIHRTALTDDGSSKREMPDDMPAKRMLGTVKNGAVLTGNCSKSIAIAEGIETALSASHIFRMPVWAVLSASGIAAFPVIYGVKILRIFADHDKPGLSAADRCAQRYRAAGIAVEVRYPSAGGTDWNDFLKSEWKIWTAKSK